MCIDWFLNKEKTENYTQSKLDQISIYHTAVLMGQVIVKNGEPLTNNKRFLINRYFYLQNNSTNKQPIKLVFSCMLVFLILIVLLGYLLFFRKPIFGQNKQIVFLYLIVLVSVISTFIFSKYGLLVLALPFALVPILVRVFFDSRTALFTHLIVVLICSLFMTDKLEFILLQLLTGIGTLFAVAEMRKRQQIVNAAALVFVFYTLIFISYQIGFGTPQLVKKISVYVPFAVSAVLVLLAYPIILLTVTLSFDSFHPRAFLSYELYDQFVKRINALHIFQLLKLLLFLDFKHLPITFIFLDAFFSGYDSL